MQYLIMCKSLTASQLCRKALESIGISATVTKAPQELRSNGCGYSLSVYRDIDRAITELRSRTLQIGKVYFRQSGGDYRELHI